MQTLPNFKKYEEIEKLEKSKGWQIIMEELKNEYDKCAYELTIGNPSDRELFEFRALAKVCLEMQKYPEKIKRRLEEVQEQNFDSYE